MPTLALRDPGMHLQKRAILAAVCAALGLGVATLVFAVPGPTACAVIGFSGLKSLLDGTLVDQETPTQQQVRVAGLLSTARGRIGSIFGTPRSKPIIVFFSNPDGFGPFKLNSFASTQFIGGRACVMVGPNGQNIDVVAHELMHVELFDRVGYWRRFTEVPVWFDEGIAMQVDYRSRYELPKNEPVDTAYVRRLESARQFFVPNDQQLTQNYAAAKLEVS